MRSVRQSLASSIAAKVSAEEKPALVAYLTSRWGHP